MPSIPLNRKLQSHVNGPFRVCLPSEDNATQRHIPKMKIVGDIRIQIRQYFFSTEIVCPYDGDARSAVVFIQGYY